MLTGKLYDTFTLESLGDDTDDDDPDDDDSEDDHSTYSDGTKKEYTKGGVEVPSQSRIFYVGGHCKGNAHAAHELMHWKYHLNEWTVDYLQKYGHLDPAKVEERANMSRTNLDDEIQSVLQVMEDKNEIEMLFTMYDSKIDWSVQVANDYRRRGNE